MAPPQDSVARGGPPWGDSPNVRDWPETQSRPAQIYSFVATLNPPTTSRISRTRRQAIYLTPPCKLEAGVGQMPLLRTICHHNHAVGGAIAIAVVAVALIGSALLPAASMQRHGLLQ